MSDSAAKSGDYLYLTIYRSLKERIVSGEYRKGERFPPERQLKDEYDTTHVTVRRALSMLVEEGYIERYSGKGTVVVFEAGSPQTDAPVDAVFRRVRLLAPGPDSLRRGLVFELNRICSTRNLDFAATEFSGDTEEPTLIRAASDESVILVYEPMNPDFRFDRYLSGIRSRVVLIGASAEENPAFCSVHLDIDQAVRESVEYLKGLGHRSVLLVGHSRTRWGRAYSSAFHRAVQAAGFSDESVAELDGMGLYSGGEQAARVIRDRLPECRAFICSDDDAASGVYGYFRRQGPDDSPADRIIIGCGNNPFTDAIGLSSVDPDHRSAGELLSRCIEEGFRTGSVPASRFMIRPHLVLRRS